MILIASASVISLLLAASAFIGLMIWVFVLVPRSAWQRDAQLPLQSDEPSRPHHAHRSEASDKEQS